MISRQHRFHGKNGLRFVYQNGNTVRGSAFAVKSVINSRRKSYRVAVVVSRKVHKSAVARNRIRRRLYAAVRELQNNINDPYDIVITVFNDSILEETPKSLAHGLKRQFEKSGIVEQ
jgi:ribonuclease P protein component